MSQRTVGSPIEYNGVEIESGTNVNRGRDIAPNDVMNPEWDYEGYEDSGEGYNTMEVKGTYMDGEFVQERASIRSHTMYHSLPSISIDTSDRYVILYDLFSGLKLPVTEEHFVELLESEALHVVQE